MSYVSCIKIAAAVEAFRAKLPPQVSIVEWGISPDRCQTTTIRVYLSEKPETRDGRINGVTLREDFTPGAPSSCYGTFAINSERVTKGASKWQKPESYGPAGKANAAAERSR